jgi:hypothetical protein
MLRRVCRERDDYTCRVCGLREPEIMHVDHILPRYVVGNVAQYDALENLVTLCPNDHARKTVADREKYGHPTWNRGLKMTEDQKKSMNMDGLALGRVWNKGKKLTTEHIEAVKASKRKSGNYARFWAGKTFSLEHRRKLSEARKGKKPWNAKAVA